MKKILLIIVLAFFPVFINAQCSVQVATTDVTCYNACNGTATVTPIGGTPPYSYAWSPNSSTSASVSGLCNGVYTAYVTDANNCVATGTITITQPTQIVISLVLTPATSSTNCDGAAVSTVTGGTPPYTYAWTPSGGNGSSASNLCSGYYNFCVTDSNNCPVCSLVTIANSVGIQNNSVADNFTIFPNPALDFVNISKTFPKAINVQMELSNTLGESISVTSFKSVNNIYENISLVGLPSGIYFVSIKTESGNSVSRFIKE